LDPGLRTGGLIAIVVALAIGGVIAAAIVPTAINALIDAKGSWSAATLAVYGLIAIAAVLAIVVAFLKPVMGK
jgi:hypothetical protein